MTRAIPVHAVETVSGRYVDLLDPDPATIVLDDIAYALSNTRRFGPHCPTFYSVAEHAVIVSRRLEAQGHPSAVCLAGLHHDDAEAFLGDIPRPVKPLLGPAYADLTRRMDAAILTALGLARLLPELHTQEVKAADDWALALEARDVMPSRGAGWQTVDAAPALDGDWRPLWLGLTPAAAKTTRALGSARPSNRNGGPGHLVPATGSEPGEPAGPARAAARDDRGGSA